MPYIFPAMNPYLELVEIDLLRKGEPIPMMGNDIHSHYRILVCRGDRRP
ncbi:DUF4058 family protein [Nostoc sp.]